MRSTIWVLWAICAISAGCTSGSKAPADKSSTERTSPRWNRLGTSADDDDPTLASVQSDLAAKKLERSRLQQSGDPNAAGRIAILDREIQSLTNQLRELSRNP